MDITTRFNQVKAVAVADLIKRHPRASIAAAVALLIAGPLLTGTGGEAFLLNLAGLGIAALVVRRIVRGGRGRQANCRCGCHRQKTQQQGGTP